MDNLLVHWSAQGRNAQVMPSFPEKNIVGQNRSFARFFGFLYLDGDTVKAHFLVLLNKKKKKSYANILPGNPKRNITSKNLQASLP